MNRNSMAPQQQNCCFRTRVKIKEMTVTSQWNYAPIQHSAMSSPFTFPPLHSSISIYPGVDTYSQTGTATKESKAVIR